MIEVKINGRSENINPQTLQELILSRDLDPQGLVIERNRTIEKREEWPLIRIQPEDEIEIITFMGGGSGTPKQDTLTLGSVTFSSRLFTGTGKFASPELIAPMLEASGSQLITVALRRVDFKAGDQNILNYIPRHVTLLPNTSGARNADEAIRIARIAREAGCGDFIKIEVITDMKYLLPDNEETIIATRILAKEGFTVLPYIQADPITCKKLEDAGAAAVMPLGAPIGSNQGLKTLPMIEIIIENSTLPVVVDAGIGLPSHAAQAMELGADAVLVNTAISTAGDPVAMGRAFSQAVQAGRTAWLAQGRSPSLIAQASSPLTGFLHLEG